MTFLEGQIVHRQALIKLWEMRIVTGECKKRKISCMDKELTDDEKVSDAMLILQRHVEVLGELTDALSVSEGRKHDHDHER